MGGCKLDDKARQLTTPDNIVLSFDLNIWQRIGARTLAPAAPPPVTQRLAIPAPLPQRPISTPYTVANSRSAPYMPPAAPVRMEARQPSCKDFENGRCQRGSGCKFAHMSNLAPAPLPMPQRAVFSSAVQPQVTPRDLPVRPPDGIRFVGFHEVLCLALEREELRKAKQYGESDRLRDDLSRLGAECRDKTRTMEWKGLQCSYDLHNGVAAECLQYVCLEREESRRDKDFARSDVLRDWLKSKGCEVHDKTHTFRADSGVSGSYELRSWQPVAAAPRGLPRGALR